MDGNKCNACSHTLNYISKETGICHYCGMPIDFKHNMKMFEHPKIDKPSYAKQELPKELQTCSMCGSPMSHNSGCAHCISCGNSLCLNG